MDNNNTQKMDNWKKQVLLDPVLNVLFDTSLSPEDLLHTKILTLPHDQILNVYTRLTSLKHTFSTALQKQVQTKHELIQHTFDNAQAYRDDFSISNNPKMHEYLNHLAKFNGKYQFVQDSIHIWKNTTNILHFSEALESVIVQSKILRGLMRGYEGNQTRQQSINPLKISKLINEIAINSTKFDFSGIATYENQKVFISSTKSIIHSLTDKNLQNCLNSAYQSQQTENLRKQITELMDILINLGTLRDFLTSYFKKILSELSQKMKKVFQQQTSQQTDNYFQNFVVSLLLKNAHSLILLEQILIQHKHIENIKNIPNLFSKYWDKLIEYFTEMLSWVRDQENRNPIKIQQHCLYWKYPTIYEHTTKICNQIHQIIIRSVEFNQYNFSKAKQRLILTLVEVGRQYHRKVEETIKSELLLEGNPTEEQLTEKHSLLKKMIDNCRNQLIFDGLMEVLGENHEKWNPNLKVKEIILESAFTIPLKYIPLFKKNVN